MLGRENARGAEVLALDCANVGEQAHDRSIHRMITARPRRAVDRVELIRDQHLRQSAPLRCGAHSIRQCIYVAGDVRLIDRADAPLQLLGLHIDEAQEMPVPDRAAGHPVVHADAPASQIGRRLHRSVLAHIKIAPGEVPHQREHGQRHEAAVALVDPAQMPCHRRLAAMHRRIVRGATQHVGAGRPRAFVAEHHAQRYAIRPHGADRERHHPRIVRTGQTDRQIGHVDVPEPSGWSFSALPLRLGHRCTVQTPIRLLWTVAVGRASARYRVDAVAAGMAD